MSGSVDITDLVDKTKSTFIDWAVLYIYGEELTIPGLGEFVALPIIKDIDQQIVRTIVTILADAVEMQGFFLNTAIRKATQASEFVAAVNLKNALPEDVSDEEYKKAEQNQMALF